jgi:hypothetical protein
MGVNIDGIVVLIRIERIWSLLCNSPGDTVIPEFCTKLDTPDEIEIFSIFNFFHLDEFANSSTARGS